jgi:hypothetical protein
MTTIFLLGSCTGERPFLQVQLCAANSQGVDLFKKTLQDIARDEHMRYIDGSAATTRSLKAINPTGKNMHTDGRLVFVGVEAESGPGLMAGNMGLNPYDISVGFGPDSAAARAFSDRVVARLMQHWRLKVVPESSGAFPDPDCTQGVAAPPNNSFKPKPLRGSA